MNKPRIDFRLILRMIPLWKIVLTGSNLMLMLGVLRFWRRNVETLDFIGALFAGVGFIGALIGVRFYSSIARSGFQKTRKIRWSGDAIRDFYEEEAEDLRWHGLVLSGLFALIGFNGYFLIFIRSSERLGLLIWLAIALLLIVCDAWICGRERFSALHDFIALSAIFVLPTALLMNCASNEIALLTIQAYLTVNALFYLGASLIQTMSDVDGGASFPCGLFLPGVRAARFRGYALTIAAAYLSLILFHRCGVQWRLLSPLLYALPIHGAEIAMLERVERGGSYRRRVHGVLGMAGILFPIYIELMTVWFFV